MKRRQTSGIRSPLRFPLLSSLLLCVLVPDRTVPAQAERLDLGLRMRAFERAYEACADPALRARAADPVNAAVQAFFGLRLSEAGRQLDRARRLLLDGEGEAEDSAALRVADAVRILPTTLLVREGQDNLRLQIDRAYPTGVDPEPALFVHATLTPLAGGEPTVTFTGPLSGGCVLPLAEVSPGDHRLTMAVRLSAGGRDVRVESLTVSVLPDIEPRLNALELALEELPEGVRTSTSETVRGHVRLLRTLATGRLVETSYPAARLLAQAEQFLALLQEGGDGIVGLTGEHWLHVVAGRQVVAIRIQIPSGVKAGERRPLVLALHGAGGSENLFFDGYGDGKVARLAAERGWVLIAPRGGFLGGAPLPALVDTLAGVLPLDRERVVVVGHSMGAGQMLAAVGRNPERFVAAAALGGGNAIRANARLKELAFFVGVGTRDFALGGARALQTSLRRLEPRLLEIREYEDVEHLAIVQRALPDVFAFFEQALKRD
jgi:pimeloyl-ACP methyl ester carboxylesterase